MKTDIYKYLYQQPGIDKLITDGIKSYFIKRDLTPPVRVKGKFYIHDFNHPEKSGLIWKTFTVKSLYPNCLQASDGWQKPYWAFEDYEGA